MCSTLKRVFLLANVILLGAAPIFAQAPPKVASAGFDLLITNATIVTMDPAGES